MEVARILIDAQIDLEKGYANFGSALHLAISQSNSEIVDYILKQPVNPSKKNESKEAPIHLAISMLSNYSTSSSAHIERMP